MKTLLFDFSNVLLFSTDSAEFTGGIKIDESFVLNKPLLEIILPLKVKRAVFTATSQVNEPPLKSLLAKYFHDVFTVESIGTSKTDQSAYFEISKLLSADPSEILFIDDSPTNIAVARLAGLSAEQYLNNQQIISVINHWNSQTD